MALATVRLIAMTSTLLGGMSTTVASAQDASAPTAPKVDVSTAVSADGTSATNSGEIVVTGSRIRRASDDSASPVAVINQSDLILRGDVQVGDALNRLPGNIPSRPVSPNAGSGGGDGKEYPNLFGLGAGRTLTLVDGRRFVSSATQLGDEVVDTNLIPIGLLERIDVVQGGGAAVYGSDAIAGVVNYVLKKDFDKTEIDVQKGISSRSDNPTTNARITAGRNFSENRGNIAVDLEYSKTVPLDEQSRPTSALSRTTVTNPANTSSTDGIPSVKELLNAKFFDFNQTGVIFANANPTTSGFLRSGGTPLQFDASGHVTAFNPGTVASTPFASGGDGYPFNQINGLTTGVEKASANLVGHYDLTDSITVSTELTYAHTLSHDLNRGPYRNILNSASSGSGPITFNKSNPFLSTSDIATLSAASPTFASGGNLYLSKVFNDLVPDYGIYTRQDVYRGNLNVDGKFDLGNRHFYWTVSGSFGRTDGVQHTWLPDNAKLNNALNAVGSANGPVCAINADAITANDDPSCVALNPFGTNVSAAARDYVSDRVGSSFQNTQYDGLATLGGDVIRLPAGTAKFSLGYEHRREEASYTPFLANEEGLTGVGTIEMASGGHYDTNEISGELLVPIVGRNFTLPLIHLIEFSAAGRHVNNSLAGSENVFDLGLRYQPVQDITFRVSRSRNFRAPNLYELYAPTTSALSAITADPCDNRNIAGGTNPAARLKNCQALFAANPNYGSLASFQDLSQNYPDAVITSGGNSNLKNEVSHTWTWGVVLEPRFVPGLRFSFDRVSINLTDGLSLFTPTNFLSTCYDSTNPDPSVCSTFTRLATASGGLPAGTIVAATQTTFNAGLVQYRGDTYDLSYRFKLDQFFHDRNAGSLALAVNAVNNRKLLTSVTGFDFTSTDGTIGEPKWQVRYNATYQYKKLTLSYELDYQSSALSAAAATIETTPTPAVRHNYVHNISAQLDLGKFALRGGIANFTDEQPSYPTLTYGDILGRRFFIGATARF